MKLKAIALVAALAATMGTSFAGSGTFGFGIELDGTGTLATNSGTTTLYALDSSGDNGARLTPTGSSATLSLAWTSASTQASPTFNLGTFVYGQNSLTLTGGSILTFKNGGSDVTGAVLEYQVYAVGNTPGSFTPVTLGTFQDNASGNGNGDQRIFNESLSTNLLSGLNPGTYVLDVYGFANTSDGQSFESNGGANFGAEFTIVPEPSTWAMMFGGIGILVAFQRLRRKSVS